MKDKTRYVHCTQCWTPPPLHTNTSTPPPPHPFPTPCPHFNVTYTHKCITRCGCGWWSTWNQLPTIPHRRWLLLWQKHFGGFLVSNVWGSAVWRYRSAHRRDLPATASVGINICSLFQQWLIMHTAHPFLGFDRSDGIGTWSRDWQRPCSVQRNHWCCWIENGFGTHFKRGFFMQTHHFAFGRQHVDGDRTLWQASVHGWASVARGCQCWEVLQLCSWQLKPCGQHCYVSDSWGSVVNIAMYLTTDALCSTLLCFSLLKSCCQHCCVSDCWGLVVNTAVFLTVEVLLSTLLCLWQLRSCCQHCSVSDCWGLVVNTAVFLTVEVLLLTLLCLWQLRSCC